MQTRTEYVKQLQRFHKIYEEDIDDLLFECKKYKIEVNLEPLTAGECNCIYFDEPEVNHAIEVIED